MVDEQNVIIIGGGLNGLACAKKLKENGVSFKLITKDIGGRVKTSPDGETNYGAYFVTSDWQNIMPYVEKIDIVHLAKAHFHANGKHYHAYSSRMIKHLPAIFRLLKELFKFNAHMRKLRKAAIDSPYRELIEANSYMKSRYHQKAGEFIKKNSLESLTKEYLEQFLWAAFFTEPRDVSTATFLGVLLTIIIPSYTFKFNFKKLIEPFRDEIILDDVEKIERLEDKKFKVMTKSGREYDCTILVIATPMNITNKLIKPQKIKKEVNVNFYHLRGKIKKEYDVKWYSFFEVRDKTAISREPNGTFLYFFSGKDNIDKYFDSWEIITKDEWVPALFFLGDEYINENPEENLFLANDHNIPGTEDSFINGTYIGNQVTKTVLKESRDIRKDGCPPITMKSEYSDAGVANLKVLSRAQNFSNWMYESVSDFLFGDILEIGSGQGTYSEMIINSFPNSHIFLSDFDSRYVDSLSIKFKDKKMVSVRQIDLSCHADFLNLEGLVDSAIALNVLEHIDDDIQAMRNLFDALRPGGRLVILVPAHKLLYNRIDKSVGHYRRYSKSELKTKAAEAGFIIERTFYFNFLSILGWFWNGNILKKEIIDDRALGFFDKIVPLLKFFEKYILRGTAGVSLIAVLKKES